MADYKKLLPGDPGPWFYQRAISAERYAFDSTGGRYLVMCFFGSAKPAATRQALAFVHRHRHIFNDDKAAFFGISHDRADEEQKRVSDFYPGFRYVWDFDGSVGKLYGALSQTDDALSIAMRRRWVILDPTLRVLKVVPFSSAATDVKKILEYVDSLPPPTHFPGFQVHAPVLVLPNVFEPQFCDVLMDLYNATNREETGFMQEVGGQTVLVHDHAHKRRRDYMIEDREIMVAAQQRIARRVNPEIEKVHQFKVTRMERYLVGCYAAEDQAHFRAHRDNTTKGTAHRRFAVSVNLNDDFEGGEVSFPEYGPKGIKVPAGGAVVFSCSLLHSVSKVTRGRRYAFLPFLYDDEAAKIREANNPHLADGMGTYSAGDP